MMLWVITFLTMIGLGTALPDYRLPDTVKPTHYRLEIITNLEDFKFTGEVWIKINCLKPTTTIVLHSDKLTINEADTTIKPFSKDNEEESDLKVVQVKIVPENKFLFIKLNHGLKAGKQYLLYIPFSGEMLSSLNGYYRSSYYDKSSNSTKWLGVTQFEPSDARRAFPCFDEPELKAQFSIRLAHKDHLKAISNMPLVKTVPMADRNGWSWDEFQESVPVSTYLVAWLISEFDYVEAPDQPNGVKFRVWARNNAIDQAEFAAMMGPKVLAFYEELYDVKYPLPKQDMAAIPDFSAGAMENWGLITYRESDLLYDPKALSFHNKERVASVIAHELAHQWFGNLVTMKWWSDLWLNEGFATYVSVLGVDHVFPEWNVMGEESLSNLAVSYDLDSLKSSHPISVEIHDPSEIREIFDTISYRKGATIIRMMHNFLGQSFQLGVSNYLKQYKYGNAEQDNLWSALTEQAHKDGNFRQDMTVKEIMDTWTLQTGYPILTITRDYEAGTAQITQKRFLRIPEQGKNLNNTWWWVPLSYTTQKEADFNDTMPKAWVQSTEEKPFEVTGLPTGRDQWVIFNVGLTALIRIQYDQQNWKLLIDTLNSDNYNSISPINRAGLLLDAFDFAHRGDLSYETALQLSSYLVKEQEYLPFQKGLRSLNVLGSLLKRTPNFGIFKKYIKALITPIYPKYNKLTEVPSSMEGAKMHELVTSWACRFEVPECVKQVRDIFSEWLEGKSENPIPTNLKSLVFCEAVQNGDVNNWEKLWERYLESNYAGEKMTILNSLGCSREIWVLYRYLEWSISENSSVRRQDSSTVFDAVASRGPGFYVAWDFLQRRVNDIYHYQEGRENVLGSYVKSIAKNMVYPEEVESLKAFLAAHQEIFQKSRLQVEQAMEQAASNVKWHRENYDTVSKILHT